MPRVLDLKSKRIRTDVPAGTHVSDIPTWLSEHAPTAAVKASKKGALVVNKGSLDAADSLIVMSKGPGPKAKAKAAAKPAGIFVHRAFKTVEHLLAGLKTSLSDKRLKDTTQTQYTTAKKALDKAIVDAKTLDKKTKISEFMYNLIGKKVKGGLLNNLKHLKKFKKWYTECKEFKDRVASDEIFFHALLLVAPLSAARVEYVNTNAPALREFFNKRVEKSGWTEEDTVSLLSSHVSGNVTKGEAKYISSLMHRCLQDALQSQMFDKFWELMGEHETLAGEAKASALLKKLPAYASKDENSSTFADLQKSIHWITKIVSNLKSKAKAAPKVKAPKAKAAPRQANADLKAISEKKGKLRTALKDALPILEQKGVPRNEDARALAAAEPNLLLPRYFQKLLHQKQKVKADAQSNFAKWVQVMIEVSSAPEEYFGMLLDLLPRHLRAYFEANDSDVIPLNVLGCVVFHFKDELMDWSTQAEKKECKKYVVENWAVKHVTKKVNSAIKKFTWNKRTRVPKFKNLGVQTTEAGNSFHFLPETTLKDKIKCALWIREHKTLTAETPACKAGRVELSCRATQNGARHYALLHGKRVYLD